MRTALLTMTMCLFVLPANAKYGGGTGEPNDPYQIATAADLIALGGTPEDYGKHFVLTADIDLDPNLPGQRVFDRAVIAPDVNDTAYDYQGPPFTGFFDGNRHVIRNLHIQGAGYLGLFGQAGSEAKISNLGLDAVDVTGTGNCVGGLVARNRGSVTACCSTGSANGGGVVGGLVGVNSGTVIHSYSACMADGGPVGGLVGYNDGSITNCYSSGLVMGIDYVGGLVGGNDGSITTCYSTGSVNGPSYVGGLVSYNSGSITTCYSTASVTGQAFYVGGLVSENSGSITNCYSSGGTGLATAEMQTASTFLEAGWDFVGETANGTEDIWWIDEGKDYPKLWWEARD